MPNLFHRLSRYRATAALHPRENQLTEAFASVLDCANGLPDHLFLKALDAPRREHRISTQVATGCGGFIDLELVGKETAPGAGESKVWVEIKHGASLHENQLESYLKCLRGRTPWTRVVFLAPRVTVRRTQLPEDDHLLAMTWETVASELETWIGKVGSRKPAHRWLVEEFQKFLDEEGLMDPKKLQTKHLAVLESEPETARAIERLWQIARNHVDQRWGESRGGDWASLGQWGSWQTACSGKDLCWPESTVFQAGTIPAEEANWAESSRGWIFGAGMTFKRSDLSKFEGNEKWSAQLAGSGFSVRGFLSYSGQWSIYRFKNPSELVREASSLEEQGTRLGEWIVETFTLLKDSARLRELPSTGAV